MLGYKRIKQASIALLAAACLVLSGCGRDGGSVSLVEAGPAQEAGRRELCAADACLRG